MDNILQNYPKFKKFNFFHILNMFNDQHLFIYNITIFWYHIQYKNKTKQKTKKDSGSD